ncbi:MAG: RidA family protein [Asticcacaulis sp.]|nr:RidA family protein [Asticcacaulis sp.]
MSIIPLDPTTIYPTGGDYRHGLEICHPQRLVYTAGTMGLDADGNPGTDLDAQLDLIWSNIAAILAEADMTTANIVRVTSYLTDRAHADANQNARLKALDGRAVPTTAIVVATLDPAWLVEIEVIAAA